MPRELPACPHSWSRRYPKYHSRSEGILKRNLARSSFRGLHIARALHLAVHIGRLATVLHIAAPLNIRIQTAACVHRDVPAAFDVRFRIGGLEFAGFDVPTSLHGCVEHCACSTEGDV